MRIIFEPRHVLNIMSRLSSVLIILAILLSVTIIEVSAEDVDSDLDGWSDYHEDSCGTDYLAVSYTHLTLPTKA